MKHDNSLHQTDMPQSVVLDDQEPIFEEPWQAQAFALAVAMQRRGVFSPHEWAQALGRQIQQAQAVGDSDSGSTYYLHWLAALESLIHAKGLADQATLVRYQVAWPRAAHRTPHGEPIVLHQQDLD